MPASNPNNPSCPLCGLPMGKNGINKTGGKGVNKYGKIEMRGAGAATKGRMSSGKMG